MSQISLKDILISARQESHRMRHYFLGVEHLFIAMLEIKGGLTCSILEDHGLSPEYVIDAVRRKIGKGGRHRLWAGTPNTPRAEIVLDIAHEIALANGRETINERDLLIGILDEGDNVAVRVMKALNLNLHDLKSIAESRQMTRVTQQSFVKIIFSPEAKAKSLTKEQSFILRRMFYDYMQIRVERFLTGGYTSAVLVITTPIHMDGREDASVVVKIGQSDNILDEAQRYERFVKSTLPPLTARIEDTPTAPETSELAAIKYTLLTAPDEQSHDIRSIIQDWEGRQLGDWLQSQLFETFGKTWWKQPRPYRFEVWREYDWLLPPILTLEYFSEDKPPENTRVLKSPLKRAKIDQFEYGEYVTVENFVVQKVEKERKAIQLAVGRGASLTNAYKIEVRGIDFASDTFFRGEIVEQITGRIWKTRAEQLNHFARALEPDFDISSEVIKIGDSKLPNPIFAYESLINITLDGSLSTIHGDLHLGNILLGPNEDALLIDFGHTRDGHTIFDWATLEVSLLSELVIPNFDGGWESVIRIFRQLRQINEQRPLTTDYPDLENTLQAILSVREIVKACLTKKNQWSEYFVALTIVCLRAMTWQTMSVDSRRLMYLHAALAINSFEAQHNQPINGETVSDTTDFISNP